MSDMSGIFENVYKDEYENTLWHISILVEQRMTTILMKGLASNTPYSNTRLAVMVRSLSDS